MSEQPTECLRRNPLHYKAVGVAAGIATAIIRLKAKTRHPKWLLKILETELVKACEVANGIAKHRDDEKP